MYKKIFLRSWKDLKNNTILFLPDLLLGIFMFIIGGLILYSSGLVPVVNEITENFNIIVKGNVNEGEQALQILTDLISLNLKKLVFALGFFVITNFLIGAGFMCMKFNMLTDVVKNKKIGLLDVYKLSKKLYWKYILLRILTTLFYIVPFLVFILIATPILFKNAPIKGTLIVILFLIYLIYGIFLFFAFYFAIPILFIKSIKPITAIKESYHYLRLRTSHVLWTWLITISIFLLILIVFDRLAGLFTSLSLLVVASIIGFVGNIANFVFNVWKSMFRFRAYKP